MKYLLIVFTSFNVLAQDVPQCPPEAILIEYSSPTTGAKRALCGYQKDGVTIKHGEELIFDSKGELIKKISYNHGKEGEAPEQDLPSFNGQNLPGTEESSSKFVDTLVGKKSLNEEQKLLATIHDLMEIMTLSKSIAQNSKFKVRACDDKPKEWLKAALFNSPIKKSYSFGANCDVDGSFVANFKSEFPMTFNLRNLEDLTSTSMKVKMSLNKEQSGVRYKFNVIEGTVSSPSRKAQFTSEYQVDIDIMTGNAQKGTQSGKIHLIKVNDKEVDLTQNIEFN